MRGCDVLVIGGGPAGSTAGHLLARAGRNALVLERERFPRFHIGESLLPTSMPLLERLGVTGALKDAGSVPKFGARVMTATGEPSVRIRFAEGRIPSAPSAFQVKRATFDEILLHRCREAGATVLEEHEAVQATRDGSGWLVRVRSASEETEVRARYLVDASGRDTFLARAQRTKEMAADHGRVAIYAHFDGVPRRPGLEGGDILLIVRRDAWFWVIPLADGATSIGLVIQGNALRASALEPDECFERALAGAPVLADLTRDATQTTQVYVTSNYSYRCGEAAQTRQNAVAIGDANAFLDPIFSTGVFLAMEGGESAAAVLDACLADPARADAKLTAWSAERRRVNRYYWRLIESFYTPEFIDLLLQPSDAPILRNLVPALTSVFAGMGPGTVGLRAHLRLFEALQALHRRFDLQPRVELGSVFDR